jgi:hypothetical protein
MRCEGRAGFGADSEAALMRGQREPPPLHLYELASLMLVADDAPP